MFYKRLPGYEDRLRVLRCDVDGCARELKDSDAAYEGWTECRRLDDKGAATHTCRAHDAEPETEADAAEPVEFLSGVYAAGGNMTAASDRVYASIIGGRMWPHE